MAPQIAIVHSPACSKCGLPMRLVSVVPDPDNAQNDLRSFECSSCRAVEALSVEPARYVAA